ncbi:hypothetical protein GUITHDRAFT_166901, partial [Guillardia theta CCMP2712]
MCEMRSLILLMAVCSLQAAAAFQLPSRLSLRTQRQASKQNICMTSRRPFIAGNWKMNPESIEEAAKLAAGVVEGSKGSKPQVAIFVPHAYLYTVGDTVKGSDVELGAQSVYYEEKGAFTGAVSVAMVKSMGCKHVLCGHSERRTIFKNSDEDVNRKVKKVLAEGLDPLLCIGESKTEYLGKLNKAICAAQLSKGLAGVAKEDMKRVTIAYEPVWAIGTGLTCDPETAQ